MVEIDNNGGRFNIESLRGRLEKVGANVTRVDYHNKMDLYTIDFYIADGEPKKQFPSSLEVDEDGNIEMVQIRMPTFTAKVEKSGLTGLERESVKKSKMNNLWDEIKEDICEILVEEVGVVCENGVIQDDGVVIRAQHGYNKITITPHIEFLRNVEGYAPITRDVLVNVTRELNKMWRDEYFNVKVVSRQSDV